MASQGKQVEEMGLWFLLKLEITLEEHNLFTQERSHGWHFCPAVFFTMMFPGRGSFSNCVSLSLRLWV